MNKVLINKQLEENNSSNNFKCFLHCLFTKYGWMDEDGGFLIHNMKNVLDEVQLEVASLEYVLFKCTAIGSIDKCERSFLFTECFWKKAVQVSFLIYFENTIINCSCCRNRLSTTNFFIILKTRNNGNAIDAVVWYRNSNTTIKHNIIITVYK